MKEQNKNQNNTLSTGRRIRAAGAAVVLAATGGALAFNSLRDSDPVKAPTATTEAPTTSTTVAPETTTTSTVPAPPAELVPAEQLVINPDGSTTRVDPVTGEPLPQDTIVTMEPSGFDIPGQAPGDPGVAGSATAIERK